MISKPHKYPAPKREIMFAARTGFLSKIIWDKWFAENIKRSWKHKKWRLLVERGYFVPHPSSYAYEVVTLNPDDDEVRHLVGDQPIQPPSVAVLAHDNEVAEIYIKLKTSRAISWGKFEAELKREDLRDKRNFDPSDATKFPDLLVSLADQAKKMTVAIELELSRKDPKRYRQMMNSYMSFRQASAIVFVTDLQVVKNGLKAAVRDTYFPEWEKPIGFVSREAFLASPTNCKIEFAERSCRLAEL